jgi:hypothetical protein
LDLPLFAALQRRLGRKTYTLSLHRSPQSLHERQAVKAKYFMKIGCVKREQKVFAKAICVTLR